MTLDEKTIRINRYPIKLGQFLKLAGIVQDGFEAKALITNEAVSVNNIVETRRGRQLSKEDVVTIEDTTYICS